MNSISFIVFLIAIAGFLVIRLILVPVIGNNEKDAKKIRSRLLSLGELTHQPEYSLVRQKYLRHLSPAEVWLESLPIVKPIDDLIEQTGTYYPAYRVIIMMAALGSIGAIIVGLVFSNLAFCLAAFVLFSALPILKLNSDRKKRLVAFEDQLPEAIDSIIRALRSGFPFNEALHFVGNEMSDPIGYEFRTVFEEINYGQDIRTAFNYLLIRVPSKNLVTLVSAVLIQRETGGNLAELLNKISTVMRKKVRFQRKLMTLTAEARMSAIVLALLPIIIFVAILISSPMYIQPLFDTEIGHLLLEFGLFLQITGVLWVRKQIDFDL